MKQPVQRLANRPELLQQLLILSALLCWSLTSVAQTQSDLLIVIDEDGVGYTAQQTLFADDNLIVIKLPTGRNTLITVFSGSGSALYRRAHENDPDKLTLVSGSVFTRFRHQFSHQNASTLDDTDAAPTDPQQLSATIAQFDTTMASTDHLAYRVTWVLPPNLELLSYSATQNETSQRVEWDEPGRWTQTDNTFTYEQIGGMPTRLTIDYLVHSGNSISPYDECLASVGPSERCSPDVDLDRVPDYRDLCISAENTDQPQVALDNPITLSDSPDFANQPARLDSTGLSPVDTLGCPDNALVVLPDVQFESGQTYLNAKSRASLDKVAVALKRMPDTLFRIATHTDNAGYVQNNQRLSENRADAIRHYLMLRGVGPNQIQARGYGETSPAHDNRTAAGRRANRRVELRRIN